MEHGELVAHRPQQAQGEAPAGAQAQIEQGVAPRLQRQVGIEQLVHQGQRVGGATPPVAATGHEAPPVLAPPRGPALGIPAGALDRLGRGGLVVFALGISTGMLI